jgi:flagellin-like hook-associated protein FlgL
MSDVVLSAAVRQNLLSLQSTSEMLATTQERLATGKKVNTALDNPTNYFTAAALDNRAGDINNLLDGISNGVQVLQAANTGVTSIQQLIDSAKSVANQVLQSTIGYSQKSSVSSAAIPGATAQNLIGNTAPTDTTFTAAGTVNATTAAGAPTDAVATGTANLDGGGATPISASTSLDSTSGAASKIGASTVTALAGKTLTVNGVNIVFVSAGGTPTNPSGNATTGFTIPVGGGANATMQDVLDDITAITGAPASFSAGGALQIHTGTAQDLSIGGTVTYFGVASTNRTVTPPGTAPLTGAALLSGTTAGPGTSAISSGFSATDTVTVNGKTIHFSTTAPTATDANGGTINLGTGSVQNLLDAIDQITGAATSASINATTGAITLHTGSQDLKITSTNGGALNALGLGTGGTGVNQPAIPPANTLDGQVLKIASTAGGTATNITFGNGPNQVHTLNQLNAALAPNNLQATISPAGVITITTSNDVASSTMGPLSGSATAAGFAFTGLTPTDPVVDPDSQEARAGLVTQFNTIIDNINKTAGDSSYGGINLLEGDTLKLIFNETGKSTLNIQGANADATGLGLAPLTANTDFIDSASANKVLAQLNSASTQLRTDASTLGSNLSVVQIRQDFNKNLVNVLQTGSSNLTLADTNEEAANSQALSTRQSIAVSALALANQSQASVLQLLR